MFKIGDTVCETNSNLVGTIITIYDNWEDLKENEIFITYDPENKSYNMSDIEKIVNGDPKDKWLDAQLIEFTADNLNEKWYGIQCFFGEYLWSCHSFIKRFSPEMN